VDGDLVALSLVEHRLEDVLGARVAQRATVVARPAAQDDEAEVAFLADAAALARVAARRRVEVELRQVGRGGDS